MIFDDKILTLHCPKCRHEIKEKWGCLKNNPEITCTGCGATIRVNGEQLAATQKTVNQKLDAIRSAIKRINKRGHDFGKRGSIYFHRQRPNGFRLIRLHLANDGQ